MAELTPSSFKQLYLGLFDILGRSSERPSNIMLRNLYDGVGGVRGLSRFSLETFSELVGLAQNECKFMPTPSWFYERSQELSVSQQLGALTPAPVEASAPGMVVEKFNQAVKVAKQKLKQQQLKADALVSSCKGKEVIDPEFKSWVEGNLYRLARDLPDVLSRARGNRGRLLNLLLHRSAVRLQYIQSLDDPNTALEDYMKELKRRQTALVNY